MWSTVYYFFVLCSYYMSYVIILPWTKTKVWLTNPSSRVQHNHTNTFIALLPAKCSWLHDRNSFKKYSWLNCLFSPLILFQISDSCTLLIDYWFRIRILLTKLQPLYCKQLKWPTLINVNKTEKVIKKNLKCHRHTKTMNSLFHFWQTLTNPTQVKNIRFDSTV
jgi:hypothetical protein